MNRRGPVYAAAYIRGRTSVVRWGVTKAKEYAELYPSGSVERVARLDAIKDSDND